MRVVSLSVFICLGLSCGLPVVGGDAGVGGGGDAGGGGAAVGGGSAVGGGAAAGGGAGSTIPRVFVIAMENKNDTAISGNVNAPYLNGTLLQSYGSAANYVDCLGTSIPSEPHYVWLEASTNAFTDWTFGNDADPSATNSTTSTAHLAAQLTAAQKSWRSYQEGLDANTGACPIHGSKAYAPKHDPFVFFTDVAGSPPAADNAFCAAHHKPFSAFAADLAAGDVVDYTFITPDLCHDMHGDSSCTNGCINGASATCVAQGDAWLAATVPQIIAWMNAHGGVLFIVWDEPENSSTQPFVVVGPHVKAGNVSHVSYTHSSYVKSLDEIFGLSTLPKASSATDFADFFEAGHFP